MERELPSTTSSGGSLSASIRSAFTVRSEVVTVGK